tara:strand:- start:18 stop:524 length:507 start_codon:yes stop_codon:yes gene_type:complete
MQENENQTEELQKLLLFSNSLGILTFSLKYKNCYEIGLMIIIISCILNTYLEATRVDKKIMLKELTSGRLSFKYMATIYYLIILSFIYHLYRKYEDYIYKNDKKGEFAKYSKQIVYIFTIIMIMELVFIINNKFLDSDTILIYSFILYLLTLRLTVIIANMYSKLRYN